MKLKFIVLMALLTMCYGCGTKKTISNSYKKEKTEIDLIDNSAISKKIDNEKQYIDTYTKERIVTLYGVRFDTIYIEGKEYITSLSYPLKKEEERDIDTEKYIYQLSVKDSIQNAVDLRYKNALDEKNKKINELKETKLFYQIALLIASICGILFIVLYIIQKLRLKAFF